MTFTSTPITVKDGASADKSIIAYNDGTSSAFAHPLLDSNGAIISPATSGNQTTANTALAAIQNSVANIPASPSTAALQTTANTSLATIATNTTGSATSAKQDTGNTSLATIATNTTGVATSAKQDTGNTALAAIVTNTSGVATSAKQDTGNTSLAAIATSVAAIATASGTEATAANQVTGNTSLAAIAGNTAAGSINLTNTPTVTAGAYTTGMVVGGKQTLANAVRASGGSGVIQSASITKKTALTAAYDVYFFQTDPTNSTFTDNAALALNVADIPFLVGVAHCNDLVDNGTPKTLQATNLGIPFKLATGTSLFAVAVIRGAETLGSTSAIVLNVGILQD